ncbi:hypothetical protein [Chryseobacterium sp. SIMBA_028]|uniref:hypothetical protein n=1 Tax=Chryseobacterium sp. SIMBA_028 TaxID=3085771 RepID=UPI00397E7EDD
MEKKIMISVFLCAYAFVFSQVGINTSNPNATLDVVSTPAATSKADGFIAPRLTGAQLKAKDNVYGSDQSGAVIFVTEGLTVAETTSKTRAVVNAGYFYFNGTEWVRFIDMVRAPAVVVGFNASGNPEPNISLPSSPQNKLSFPIINIAADATIGSWNSAGNEYTVAKRGVYMISATLTMENMTDLGACGLHIHGGSQIASSSSSSGSAINLSTNSSMILDPGDVIWIGASRNPNLSGFTAGYRALNIIFSEIN